MCNRARDRNFTHFSEVLCVIGQGTVTSHTLVRFSVCNRARDCNFTHFSEVLCV